jgi:putative ABC transport system permease protein
MLSLFLDLQHAQRTLRKHLGFTLIAVATLALGIGANTAIFSVVYAVLLQPLPFSQPDRLVSVWPEQDFSKADFIEFDDQSRQLQRLAAYTGWTFTLTGLEEPLKLNGTRATSGLFKVLGARAALGRVFLPGEDRPGKDQIVILSDGLWRRIFGRNPSVIGRTIELDHQSVVVVGVMPPDFHFPTPDSELWAPASLDPSNPWDFTLGRSLKVLGRLRPGVSREQARAEVVAIAHHLSEKYPHGYEQFPDAYPASYGTGASVISLHDQLVGNKSSALLILFAATGLVLLVACANVVNLQLARARSREKELALRTVLGAGRSRLIQQILSESILLAGLGGVLGLFLAYAGLRLLTTSLAPGSIHLERVGLNGWVLAFTVALGLATGLLFGLVPALRVSRPNLNAALKEGGRTSGGAGSKGRYGLDKMLVVAEIAFAVMLVISAGLLIKSFWRLSRVDPGFRSDHVVKMQLSPPFSFRQGARIRAYYTDVLRHLTALPGVRSVGTVQAAPLSGETWSSQVRIDGMSLPAGSASNIDWHTVSPDYFKTLGIPVLEGRPFTAADDDHAPRVAVIDQAMARRFWPHENALGKRIATDFEGEGNWATVVGVVGDVKYHDLASATAGMYRPFDQVPRSATMTVLLHVADDPLKLISLIRREIWAVDRNVPISEVATLQAAVVASTSEPRFNMMLLGLFAGVALILGAIGIYGVISYLVNERSREFGIRMALGADEGGILGLVVGQGCKLALVGLAIGLVGALGATRVVSTLLFGVKPNDPTVFAGVALIAFAAAFAASYLPARRAAKSDPLVSLRAE